MTQDSQKNISATLEAVLFMYGVPVTLERLAEVLEVSEDAIKDAAESLKRDYDDRESRGLAVMITEGKVQIVTSEDQAQVIASFTKKELEGDLSQAALEVLAIVAYRGPIAKPDVEAVRGVNCSFTLRNLLLRGLVEQGPHPTDKRTQLYKVAPRFLRVLGLDQQSDLPNYDVLAGDSRIDAILYSEQVEEITTQNNEE